MIGAGMTKAEFTEQVRVNLVRYLERRPAMTLGAVAHATGYSPAAIRKYHCGQRTTIPVAMTLLLAFPELGEGIVCPSCGAVPALAYR